MKLLKDLDVSAKKVFLRADLDVPLETKDDQTIVRLINLKPTIDYLLDHQAKQIIIAGHIDRPTKPDPVLSTNNLRESLEKILTRSVAFRDNLKDHDSSLNSSSQLILLENLRFWPGETENDADFAQKLVALADLYVNDAFGTCHRAHASIVALPALLPHAAGLHLAREIDELSKLLAVPIRPFVAIIGGDKIETKLPTITNLAKVADFVLVGGAIARESQISNQKVILAAPATNNNDISQTSIDQFKSIITTAKTVVWNGPMGVFEKGFDHGTLAIATSIVESGAYSVVGGDSTTEFLSSKNLLPQFSFASSGGGAMLEFLAGRQLPGIKALE